MSIVVAALVWLTISSSLVFAAPTITQQPQNRTVIAGTNVNFSVIATGPQTPFSYQWSFNGTNLTNNAQISGATTNLLNLTGVGVSNAGNYRVVVTDRHANSSTSSVATLTIWLPPAITAQPQSSTMPVGSNVLFSVIAEGTAPLAYQWRSNGIAISGATSASLSLTNLQLATTGDYTVVITNVAGSTTSAVAVLTVLFPPSITTQPQSAAVSVGSNVLFSVIVDGAAPLAYQWRFNGIAIPGATSTSLSLTNLQLAAAGDYTVVITNVVGSTTSDVATLVVIQPPILSVQPTNKIMQAGTTINLQVSATGSLPLSYQWQKDGVTLADGGRFSGVTGPVLSISGLQSTDNGGYSVIVSNDYGMVTSVVATLKVGLSLPGLKDAVVAWGDYDRDGLMDILMAGVTSGGARYARLYHNIGATLFEENAVVLPQVSVAAVAWGDYDNDGDLDFVISGEKYEGYQIAVTEVYRNDGSGLFTNINAGVEPESAGDVIWVDFNNDGWLDIYLGRSGRFWRNQGDGTFKQDPNNTVGAYPARVDWGDLDNDGDQDFTLIAPLNFNGLWPDIVRNDGPKGFPRYSLPRPLTYGHTYDFVDYDNDGDLDVAFSDYFAQKPVSFFQNDGHGNLTLTNLNMRPFSALASSWGDYNNDGKPDCLTMEHGAEGDLVEVLFDEGTNWNHCLWFSSVWQASASFIDIDNDGDLDVFYTGGFASFTSFTHSGFLINTIAATNTPPTAPSGLTHEIVKGNTVYLRWTPAADAQTPSPGLNYNLRVGTTPGGIEIMSPEADLATGRRYLPARGNAGPTNFWMLRELPLGTYYWSVQAIDPTFAGSPFPAMEGSFTITSAPPRIVSQPLNQTRITGETALFTVTNTGTVPVYQWQKNGLDLVDGGNVSGAITATLAISGVVSNDAGSYRVIITNNWDSITSAIATLTVWYPPVFLVQPTNLTIAYGASASLVSQATGSTPLAYRWQRNGTNLINGGSINGVTSATLQLTGAQPSDSANYTVIVTNVAGFATSSIAVVTILPLVITTQPASRTLPAGTNVTFSVNSSGVTPFTYQWRFNQATLLNRTNSTLSLTNIQAASMGDYDVVVSNLYTNVTSGTATLTVIPAAPIFTTQAVAKVASVGQNILFTAAAKGTEPITFQWQREGTNLPGANLATLTLSNVSFSFSGSYRVNVSNEVGSIISTNAALVVSPVWIWGMTNNPQLSLSAATIPATATNVIAIAAAPTSDLGLPCMALRADGSMVPWGYYSRDTVPPFDATNLVAISLGAIGSSVNSLVLRADGTALNWNSKALAPSVSNQNLVAIAAGGSHQLALRDDGTVFAWGSNTSGQTNVPAAATNIIAIAAGNYHSLALRADGTVIGWGFNTSGQATALSNAVDVIAIAAGGNQTMALLADGTVTGRIVTNTPGASVNYGPVTGDISNKITIAAGAYHGLAIGTNRTVNGWGATNYGQINIPAALTNVLSIAAGGYNSLALVNDPFAPPISPRIARPPIARSVVAGQSAVFNALAVGGLPLTYQWLRDGVPVAGQTRSSLMFTNVPPGAAGNYQLVAMNAFGAVTSAVMTVSVNLPQPAMKSAVRSDGTFSFNLDGIAGVLYVVEYRNSLETGTWLELESRLGNGGTEIIQDTNSLPQSRFYRVRAVYPPPP
jgi:predicted aconitase with swiveling domain